MADGPTLIEATTYAFAPDGPVARTYGEHRPEQMQSALEVASFIEQHAFQEPNTVPVMMQEQPGGVGKTVSNGVVAALDVLLNNRRAIVATFRRTLRRAYLEESPAINQIVLETLTALGCGKRYREIVLAEHKSATSFISPAKVAVLRQRLHLLGGARERELPEQFLQWFDSAGGEYFPLEFSDWYDQPEAIDGILPFGYTEQDLSFGVSDRTYLGASGRPYEAVRQWQEERANNLENADVLLVTHAMLVRNSIARGRVMRTDEEDQAMFTAIGAVIVDEADKLPDVAQSSLTFSISTGKIDDILLALEQHRVHDHHAQRLLERAFKSLEEFQQHLRHYLDDDQATQQTRIIGIFANGDEERATILENLHTIDVPLQTIRQVARGYYNPQDTDIVLADQIRGMLDQVRAMLAGAEYSLMKLETYPDVMGEYQVRASVNFSAGRSLITQMWRPVGNDPAPLHFIGVVVMVSAALTDRPPNSDQYHRFSKALGVDDRIDRVYRKAPILRLDEDAIEHVIVISRDDALHPTDERAPFMLNSAWIAALARAIGTAADRQRRMGRDAKMIVLFHSHAALAATLNALPKGLEDRVITLRGRDWKTAMRAFAELRHGIWFGTEWEGANFTDPDTNDTMAHTVVIARIPQPPIDMIRSKRIENGLKLRDVANSQSISVAATLHESVEIAYRRMRQGVMRGLRHKGDTIRELYILDIRYPVPPWVTAAHGGGRIVTSVGDPRKLFRGFDQILKPYDVGQWSQIDAHGEIKRIVP